MLCFLFLFQNIQYQGPITMMLVLVLVEKVKILLSLNIFQLEFRYRRKKTMKGISILDCALQRARALMPMARRRRQKTLRLHRREARHRPRKSRIFVLQNCAKKDSNKEDFKKNFFCVFITHDTNVKKVSASAQRLRECEKVTMKKKEYFRVFAQKKVTFCNSVLLCSVIQTS